MGALLEMSGAAALQMHLLMGALLLARLLHPLGMYAKPGTFQFNIGRVGGMVITVIVMIGALLILLRLSVTGVPLKVEEESSRALLG
jgi:hypothetical protein